LHSIREFDKDVAENEREPLNEDEMEDNVQRGILDSLTGERVKFPLRTDGEKPEKAKKTKSFGKVKQAKIVRLHDRVDPLIGKGRSKGYGFLELERHSDALKVLRWANNNPKVGSILKEWWHEELKDMLALLDKKKDKNEEETARWKRLKDVVGTNVEEKSKRTLIVEFSIENVLIVKKREGRDAQGPVRDLSDIFSFGFDDWFSTQNLALSTGLLQIIKTERAHLVYQLRGVNLSRSDGMERTRKTQTLLDRQRKLKGRIMLGLLPA